MNKQPKRLRTLLLCIAIVLTGGVVLHLIEVIFDTKEPKVENIIFMIGDGMGISHISATQIQQDYKPLAIERAEFVGLCKTHSTDNTITDSAAAGTALAIGYKTNNEMIGVTPDGTPHPSVRERAERAGMATGIVATYAVTHATPAAFVAHTISRHLEEDIATYYLTNQVDVFMGGGSKFFNQRSDSRNLLDSLKERGYTVAFDISELEDVEQGRVALLASPKALPSANNNRGDFLPKATHKALEILTNNATKEDTGFFLMVEGSQIDGKAHGNDLEGTVLEIIDFDAAVEVAFNYADTHPGTLVVVTADHETGGLTIINGSGTFDPNDKSVDYEWSTSGHSGAMVPIFAYGTGAEHFSGVFDNTDLPRIMWQLLGLEE